MPRRRKRWNADEEDPVSCIFNNCALYAIWSDCRSTIGENISISEPTTVITQDQPQEHRDKIPESDAKNLQKTQDDTESQKSLKIRIKSAISDKEQFLAKTPLKRDDTNKIPINPKGLQISDTTSSENLLRSRSNIAIKSPSLFSGIRNFVDGWLATSGVIAIPVSKSGELI